MWQMYLHVNSLPPASPFLMPGHWQQDELINTVLLGVQTPGLSSINILDCIN